MALEINVGIIGCFGRMGQALADVIMSRSGIMLAAGADHPDHPRLGHAIIDEGPLATGSADAVFQTSDVVIDFTPPSTTAFHTELAAKYQTPLVIGTTGLSDHDHAAIDKAAAKIPICQAGNYSLGVNVLTALTEMAAKALPAEDWDIEIVEAHHRYKIDAPSGTAVMLGQAAAKGRGISFTDHAILSREGVTGEREKGTIGFAAIRGGNIIGEHSLMLIHNMERIELAHRAEDRSVFAGGAVTAARWLTKQSFGRYNMQDVLGFTKHITS